MKRLVIGTRGSKLALRQTEMVAAEISKKLADQIEGVDIEIIKTRGDRFLDLSLTSQPDKGLFTREIEEKLLDGSIDLAVHSLKDLPIECQKGTRIGAYLQRAATSDVVIGKLPLEQLEHGDFVGTSSKRRAFQLQIHYPHLQFKEIRGNVETRIAKLDAGEYDAIIMAEAGIRRLGLENRIVETLSERLVVPAPGQGAIAIHIRENDEDLHRLLQKINDPKTQFEVEWERSLLGSLGGGCAMPLGCVCHKSDSQYRALAFFSSEKGDQHVYVDTSFEKQDAQKELQNTVEQLKKIGVR